MSQNRRWVSRNEVWFVDDQNSEIYSAVISDFDRPSLPKSHLRLREVSHLVKSHIVGIVDDDQVVKTVVACI